MKWLRNDEKVDSEVLKGGVYSEGDLSGNVVRLDSEV